MTFQIDDITWNDLSMDQVCEKINTAKSSVGQEYLVRTLKTLLLEEKELSGRAERVSCVGRDPELAARLQKIYKDLGRTKKISLYDYIFRFHEIKPAGNALHYVLGILLLAAICILASLMIVSCFPIASQAAETDDYSSSASTITLDDVSKNNIIDIENIVLKPK